MIQRPYDRTLSDRLREQSMTAFEKAWLTTWGLLVFYHLFGGGGG